MPVAAGVAPLALGLIVALGLALVALAVWGLMRLTAWEPTWLPRLRHAIGEAGYRSGATWSELRDWLSPRRR